MSNKDLWHRVCMTDPKAVKPITGKQYSGNSPKPYWIVERLTDEFGPCGIGWGLTILSERIERFNDTDTLHIAVVRLWYVLDGKRGEIEQIGQTKASYVTSKGTALLDEDAPKKSVTDAMVKCASYLGFAGDIFSGRWDDSKYVAEAAREWEARKQPQTTGMDPELIKEWILSIESATQPDVVFNEATEAAKEAKDRDAYVAFRTAYKARQKAA